MGVFWGRSRELDQIRRWLGKGRFGYVTGRRRVGKSALLERARELFGGVYHQAVEGTPPQQLLHLVEELREAFPVFRDVIPKGWGEFFRLLSRERMPRLLVFDEFPYWVSSDPDLPSLFQKWVDHDLPKHKTLVLVSGSSQSMLHSQFLDHASPLYGRATLHLHLEPLSYAWFCRALGHRAADPESFGRFALVGGVPHYWKLMPKGTLAHQAQQLYFEPSAVLAEEPIRLLRDEGVTGALPKAILDLVGRGVSKPSELAARLGTAHSNLSRPLALLLDLGLIHRELPFGESARTTKRVLYSLRDPALSFYYGTYLPLRSRWPAFGSGEKRKALIPHLSRQWEIFCRQLYPGAGRYWEGAVEVDLVAPLGHRGKHLVAECKWTRLSPRQEQAHRKRLRERFARTKLNRSLKKVEFRVLTPRSLLGKGGKGAGLTRPLRLRGARR